MNNSTKTNKNSNISTVDDFAPNTTMIDDMPEEWILGVNDKKFIKLANILSIGQSQDCDLVLDGDHISPIHCKLYLHQNMLGILDLATQHGTYVNNIKIPSKLLKILCHDDFIVLGDHKLKIYSQIPLILEHIKAKVHDKLKDEDNRDLPQHSLDFAKKKEKLADKNPPFYKRWTQQFKLFFHRPRPEIKIHIPFFSLRENCPPINLYTRFISFLCDLGAVYLLQSYLQEIVPSLQPITNDISLFGVELYQFISPYLLLFPHVTLSKPQFLAAFNFLTFYLLFESFFLLFTGLPFGKLICGVKTVREDLGIVLNRLTGLIRDILGILTFPLIIADLPALLNRRTLKEVISGNYFTLRNNYLQFISPILFLPLVAAGFLFLPFFQEISPLDQSSSSSSSSSPRTLSLTQPLLFTKPTRGLSNVQKLPFSSEQRKELLYSRIFNLFFNESLLKDYVVIPHASALDFYNTKTKKILTFKTRPVFSIHKLLVENEGENPLFSHFFPELYQAINEKNTRLINKQRRPDQIRSSGQDKELQTYLQTTFNLSLENFIDSIVKLGPLLSGPLHVKKELLNQLRHKKGNLLEVITLNNRPYLISLSIKTLTMTMLPLSLSLSGNQMTEVSMKSAVPQDNTQKFNIQLMENLFKFSGTPTLTSSTEFAENKALQQTAFELFDTFEGDLKKNNIPLQEKYRDLLEKYEQLAKTKEDTYLSSFLREMIQNTFANQ